MIFIPKICTEKYSIEIVSTYTTYIKYVELNPSKSTTTTLIGLSFQMCDSFYLNLDIYLNNHRIILVTRPNNIVYF